MTIANCLLQFQFKGNRNYVQGTDIYSKINKVVSEDEGSYLARLRFIDLLKSNAMFSCAVDEDSQNTSEVYPCAIGEICLKTGHAKLFKVVPDTNSRISGRSEYPEHQITSKLIIDRKVACLTDLTGFSLIEEAVASIKHLSNIIVPPKSGKWLFAGIQLNELMPVSRNYGQALKVAQRQIVANRFSRNDVYLGDKVLATIEFSVGEI